MADTAFAGWAILELMGHRRRVGYCEEVEIAGGKMLRIDIHGKDDTVLSEFYGSSAIYALRPVSEEVARDASRNQDVRPVRPAEYGERPQLPAARSEFDEGYFEGDD